MKKPTKSIWPVVTMGFLLVASICVEVYTVRIFLKAKAVENWPTTTGTITRSELTSKFHGRTTHEAQIEYE